MGYGLYSQGNVQYNQYSTSHNCLTLSQQTSRLKHKNRLTMFENVISLDSDVWFSSSHQRVLLAGGKKKKERKKQSPFLKSFFTVL